MIHNLSIYQSFLLPEKVIFFSKSLAFNIAATEELWIFAVLQ